jgi:CRISPR-associated protein Cmr4
MENMITDTTMLYLYTETPLHAGVGSGLSSIDLPIQRERTTQYPMIQGSGIKGKLRATAEEAKVEQAIINILFGASIHEQKSDKSNPDEKDYAGALIAGDARILLFPVRSLNGVFAYTTSCDILNRFKRDIERSKGSAALPWSMPENEDKVALVTTANDVASNNAIVLEDFSFDVQTSAQVKQQVDTIADWIANNALPTLGTGYYWPDKVRSSLVILPNDDFRDFTLHATEVITRVRINRDSKTVESGALWTEEHLPTDTLMYVPMYATAARNNGRTMSANDVLKEAKKLEIHTLQLGGDETVGRGIVRTRWSE